MEEVQSIGFVDEDANSPLLRSANPDGAESHNADNNADATVVLIFSTFISLLGSYVFGTAAGFSSPAQSGIIDDLGLSLAEYSLFGSILTIGAMLGGVMSGKVADVFGRRVAMGFSQLFCLVGWIAILFAKSSWWLDIGRFLTGYGIGIQSYVVPVYIAEITPRNLRGAFTAGNQLMICYGSSVMFVIGNFLSWRTLALIGSVPCLLQILGLFFIPESPRWLAKMDRWKDCATSLQLLRGDNADISGEAAEIKDYSETFGQHGNAKIIDLFSRKYTHPLIIGVGLMALQQFGGINAISYYASEIFQLSGFSTRAGTLAMVIVQTPMTTLGTFLTDKVGRIPLLMISAAGTCLGCFLTGLSFLIQDLQIWKSSPLLALVGLLVYLGSFSMGMGAIPWVIMSEIFPMNVKGMAGSLVTVVNWFSGWMIAYYFNFLTKWISSEGTFFIFSIVCGLTIIFVAKLVPETKGRTLEEIQASMVLFTRK